MILDVPVRASILKVFFAVNVQLVNNASVAIIIRDNKLKLNVPDGLTIMNAEGYQSAAMIEFDKFAGQKTKTFSWILCGDTVGEYEISADYEGVVDLSSGRLLFQILSCDCFLFGNCGQAGIRRTDSLVCGRKRCRNR